MNWWMIATILLLINTNAILFYLFIGMADVLKILKDILKCMRGEYY